MALYADTCILLPLFFRDASTEAALAWLEEAGNETILISPWTRTEFASAAGIMALRGDVSVELHQQGLARFDRLADARLFGRIRRMQARFDTLFRRIEAGYDGVPEEAGIAEIEAAVATERRAHAQRTAG